MPVAFRAEIDPGHVVSWRNLRSEQIAAFIAYRC
jgi:hypothetical protein